MAPLSTQPKPCLDSHCRGQHEPSERIAMATILCKERGAQFTKLRRRILEFLWEGNRPMGAYELVEIFTQDAHRRVAPQTVYRALEFLTSHGLVARIESRNAYVPHKHPERHQDSLFFICSTCGGAQELEDQRLENLILESAAQIGFHASRRVIEVEGTCTTCGDAGVSLAAVET